MRRPRLTFSDMADALGLVMRWLILAFFARWALIALLRWLEYLPPEDLR